MYEDNALKLLLENFSAKNILLILALLYSFNKGIINYINDSNFKYFLQMPISQKKDIFGWNLLNYLTWYKRKRKIIIDRSLTIK